MKHSTSILVIALVLGSVVAMYLTWPPLILLSFVALLAAAAVMPDLMDRSGGSHRHHLH